MKTTNAIVTFEHLEKKLSRLADMLEAGQHAEVRQVAAHVLAELRGSWGYGGKSETHRHYLQQFNFFRAEACRRMCGIGV